MVDRRVRCMFCYHESQDHIQRSREHLISRPIAKAFRIDREATVLRVDADGTNPKWRPLNGISRDCVCRTCNSTWMNQLEHDMVGIAEWLDGREGSPLGQARELTLRRWALKTHMLLCFLEGEAGRFMDESNRRAVLSPVSLGRAIHERDNAAVLSAPVGIARAASETDFSFAFGHPTMRWEGPNRWNPRFAPASVVTIGPLQIWTVTPHLDADVFTPIGIMPCGKDIRPRDLTSISPPLNVSGIVVDYGEAHDAEEVLRVLRETVTTDGSSE